MSKLMVSVSGIRGTLGDTLTPQTIVKYSSAFAEFCSFNKIILGRDARLTGPMVRNLVIGTLQAKGIEVIDIGICATPTVLYYVKKMKAAGGIMISASHNPNEWNALKLINSDGEFMTPEQNKSMLSNLDGEKFSYSEWNKLGRVINKFDATMNHIQDVLEMDIIDKDQIVKRKFKVLLDCVNGAGSFIMPYLLNELGCDVIYKDCEKKGIFPRAPEPVPENLADTIAAVKNSNVDLGIVVDPDVDRLVLITNTGEVFIEENTIVQIVKFVLSKQKGNVVVNLSTTRGVDAVAEYFGCKVFRSPVGEANVVKKMKEVNAIVGGEGSGGVIFPKVVFGRDAITGTALTLQHLVEYGKSLQEMKDELPKYYIKKNKIEIGEKNPDKIIESLIDKFSAETINTDDGLRIDFEDHWVHLRKSNTEPIIRCIVEAESDTNASKLSEQYLSIINGI